MKFLALKPDEVDSIRGQSETASLEFKRDAAALKKDDNRPWLRTASALANTHGGHLLVGVAAKDGVAMDVPGIDKSEVDPLLLRLEQSARSSLTPPLHVNVHRVPVGDAKELLILNIPRSRIGPHMVMSEDWRFWRRTNSGNDRMGVSEIRNAMMSSQSAEERALARLRDFVAPHRLRMMHSTDDRPDVAIGFIPAIDAGEFIDPTDNQIQRRLEQFGNECGFKTFGRLTFTGYSTSNPGDFGEFRVDRSGEILALWRSRAYAEKNQMDSRYLLGRVNSIVESVAKWALDSKTPMPLLGTMIMYGTRSWTLRSEFGPDPSPILEETLEFPPMSIEAFPPKPIVLVRDWLDRLWQASGLKQCPLFVVDTGEPRWDRV